MPAIEARRLRTIILCILSIHVHYAGKSGADHSRVKSGTLMAYRGQGQVPVPSPSFFVPLRGSLFFPLFQPSLPSSQDYPTLIFLSPGGLIWVDLGDLQAVPTRKMGLIRGSDPQVNLNPAAWNHPRAESRSSFITHHSSFVSVGSPWRSEFTPLKTRWGCVSFIP